MSEKRFFVYIVASGKNGTLYIGVTSDLVRRIWEHKNGVIKGFTEKYGVHRLVYFEMHEQAEDALLREKRLKKWKRSWKVQLIQKANPFWKDLYAEICE